jgi:uncharacterized FlaG/YvyC family protein
MRVTNVPFPGRPDSLATTVIGSSATTEPMRGSRGRQGDEVAASGREATLPVAPLPGEQLVDDGSTNHLSEQLDKALQAINHTVHVFDRKLQFEKHEATGRFFVRVINTDTGDVVREIPPERILNAVGQMLDTLGLLVDERV